VWGRQWPAQPKPNVHPPAGPVTVVRAASYTVQLSIDGHRWRTVLRITNRRHGRVDAFRFAATRACFARLRITRAATKTKPMLQELTLTG